MRMLGLVSSLPHHLVKNPRLLRLMSTYSHAMMWSFLSSPDGHDASWDGGRDFTYEMSWRQTCESSIQIVEKREENNI